jgi:hypothetical protein
MRFVFARSYVASHRPVRFVSVVPRCVVCCAICCAVQMAAQSRNIDADLPEKEFVVCALDLLSGVAEAMENNFEPLVGPSNILPLLLVCIKDPDPDVRQSAFALLGDIGTAQAHKQADGTRAHAVALGDSLVR